MKIDFDEVWNSLTPAQKDTVRELSRKVLNQEMGEKLFKKLFPDSILDNDTKLFLINNNLSLKDAMNKEEEELKGFKGYSQEILQNIKYAKDKKGQFKKT